MSDPEMAIEALSKIAALGSTLAIDDFGTGYSSFSYLKRLPIHLLKIDRSFVTDIGHSREDEEIVTAIIQVALALKARAETAQQHAPTKAKKGKILYRIPDHMQVQKEVKCPIRV